MTVAKVGLGRRLFYDTRLSGNGTFACATCHQQAHAFTDGRARAIGSTGAVHARSAMTLTNVAYNASLGWADPTLRTLEAQMAVPMFNEHPIELGLKGREAEVVSRLSAQADDRAMFQRGVPRRCVSSDAGEHRQGDCGVRAHARVRRLTRSIAIFIATTGARCPRRRFAG